MIDFFAQRGISISLIDKSSGLLIAKTRLTTQNWTYESGTIPANPNAYVVVSSCGYMTGFDFKDFHPSDVEGEWNVRIKEQDGKTLININLFNLKVEGKGDMINGAFYPNPCSYQARSTGVFEKSLANLFAGE